MKEMNFAHMRAMCSKFQKMIFDTSSLTVPSFIYVRPLVEKSRRIKARVLLIFEDFSVITFIQIHSFDDAYYLQNFVAPSL